MTSHYDSKLEPVETPAQFAERLKRYLEKWREMAGFEPTYEGIQEMILRDQYFLTCDKFLQMALAIRLIHTSQITAKQTLVHLQ